MKEYQRRWRRWKRGNFGIVEMNLKWYGASPDVLQRLYAFKIHYC